MEPIVIDEHLVLELIATHHAAELFGLVNHNRVHLAEYLGWVSYMKEVQDMHRYIDYVSDLNRQGLDYGFVIKYDGAIVGRIGLHYINLQNKVVNIGYWLAQDAVGKGIITAAVKAIIAFCFQELNMNRLEIKAAVQNQRSRAIPEKLGFGFEGILREAECVNGAYFNLALYSLLRKEYNAEAYAVS